MAQSGRSSGCRLGGPEVIVSEELRGLIDFARIGGWHWREPYNAVFGFMTGDPDEICTIEDGAYVIRKHERGMVSKPEIRSVRLEDIDKYLSFRFGNTVRRERGLSNIWLPVVPPAEVGEERDGYSFSGSLAEMIVSWTDSDVRREVVLGSRSAAKWVQYSRFSAADIRQSYLNPDGSPLFSS